MTKREAVKHFRANILPEIIEAFGKESFVARRTAWNIYTDQLREIRFITPKQYATWESPFK